MNRFLISILASLILILVGSCETENTEPVSNLKNEAPSGPVQLRHPSKVNVVYPPTQKVDSVDNYQGTRVSDPYQWLENSQEEAVQQWLNRQNQLTQNYLKALPERDKIQRRLTELYDYTQYSKPQKVDNYYYYQKRKGENKQPLVCRSKDFKDENEEVFLDPNGFSEDGTTSIGGYWFSNNGHYMAYSTSKAGSDWNSISIINTKSKKTLPDQINWVKFSEVAWYKNGFFYARYAEMAEDQKLQETNQFHQVYYHKLGTSQDEDELIFADRSHPSYFFNPQVTDDERYLIINVAEGTDGNGLLIKDLRKKKSYVESLITNFENDYEVLGNNGSNLIIKTNYQAPNYQIININLKKSSKKNWSSLVPQMPEVLSGGIIAGKRLLLNYIKDVRNNLKVYQLDGKYLGSLKLPKILGAGSPVSISQLTGKLKEDQGFFMLQSFTIPPTVCEFSIKKRQAQVIKAVDLAFQAEDFITEQHFHSYKDRNGDSITIPIYIIHKKGIDRNGKNPCILYGYGGFNISLMPRFALGYLPFMEAGGIYAVANIRGGGEYGKNWHEAGTRLNKQNVFDDFIASAEALITRGYTSKEKLAIEGHSNGGLLVGACMTQRPDLFRVAIPAVGVLDMLRYHRFTIGYAWAPDYGRSDEPDQFRNLLSYSPLHNIRATAYPATLVMTADHDDRVVPAHSFKFAAALQAQTTSHRPILLHLSKGTGHGAGKPLSKRIEETADKLAFILFNLR